MGGDDLGSDDEYLNPSISDAISLREKLDKVEDLLSIEGANKRKRDEVAPENEDLVDESPTKKPSARILIEAGRGLANESADVQCAFLRTVFAHEIQLRGHSIDKLLKFTPSHFVTSNETALEARLREVVPMKKLKKWKTVGSPMVVVVCMSARRAVALLKELSRLKLRAIKLFAKHMDVSQQRTMLAEQPYGLAVGTPHRLLALCENDPTAALQLKRTSLVILDSHTNPKGFTVCTLPDTGGDTMELLRRHVLPQLETRKDVKIAML